MALRTLYDHTGKSIALGAELGRGGEGIVFESTANPKEVAKFYHKSPGPDRAEKLRAMVATAVPELLKMAAWPTATLHAMPNGPVVGLLMPKVVGHKEIHMLYSPAHRKQFFPEADWAFLAHTAMNCTIAFEAIHGKGHVIGDVNQSNFLVHPKSATVCLIDCDSYQVRWNGRAYPCEVGVPQYTPPELQGRSFKGVERTANHDLFGLAVLIFHLLFMGRHPFAGRFLGAGEMPLEKAIQECRFAFSRSASANQMAPPPMSLPVTAVSPDTMTLFEQAFARSSCQPNGRPSASRWKEALGHFLRQLKPCSIDPGHRYLAHVSACTWCELMRAGAPNFFVAVAVHKATPGMPVAVFVLATAWAEIDRVPAPKRTYQRPLLPANFRPMPGPLPSNLPGKVPPRIVLPRQFLHVTVAWVALASLTLMPMIVCGLGNKLLLFLGLVSLVSAISFGAWWAVLEFIHAGEVTRRNAHREQIRQALHEEYQRREQVRATYHQQLAAVERQWDYLAGKYDEEFIRCKKALEASRNRYQALKSEYDAEYKHLERNAEAIQRSQFLENEYISDHEIKGIGTGRQAVLASYGIETADDIVKDAILAVPGFGPVLTQHLLDWRQGLERKFRFDPKTGVPQEHLKALAVKYRQIQQSLQLDLQQGPAKLRVIATQAEQHLGQVSGQIQDALLKLVRAEADLSVIE